jgi:hypothetical protein
VVYKARLDKAVRDPQLPHHLRDLEMQWLLEVPDAIDPRVVALGESIAAGKTDSRAKIDAVLRHFSRGFSYSLDPLEGTSDDPLTRFLFEAKQGHCELYAAAVAVLLRIAGVPARVATGYYGGKWNSLGGYLVYTSQDAHAWVEAYDPDRGWSWIDATPEDLRSRRPVTALQFLRDWYDAVEGFWFDRVIDFDETRRRRFLERAQDLFAAMAFDDEGAEEAELESGAKTRRGPKTPWIALFAVLPLAGAAVYALRRRRRGDPEVLGRRVRRALGGAAEENVTLGALVARVDPRVRAEAEACVAVYEAWRFGPPEGAPPLAHVLERVNSLERARSGSG